MSDEVDDLLRRTMATLDRQVPDGYFDTLVSRTLGRLDDPALGEPLDQRGDELSDEDAAPASSSPGWKAVALSEPAKPPSEPMLEVVDELARERAAREARAARTSQARDPAPASPATDQAATTPGRRARSRRRPIVAVVGLGLAAAAGAMIFVGVRDKSTSAPEAAQAREQAGASATSSAPAGEPKAAPSQNMASGSAGASPEPANVEAPAGSAARGDQIAQPEKRDGNAPRDARPAAPAVEQGAVLGKTAKKPIPIKGRGKAAPTDEPTKFKGLGPEDMPGEGKPGGSAPWTGKTKAGHDGERPVGKPSKQGALASDGDKSGADTPSLSSDDFKRGMTAVAAKARACFAGTEGSDTARTSG